MILLFLKRRADARRQPEGRLLPGEYYVTRHGEMVTTVLGSCVSACVRDARLKIGGMNQLPRMLERSFHVLLGERQRLFGHLGSRARHRRHRLACRVKEHAEGFFGLIYGFFRQVAQFGGDFQFRFVHLLLRSVLER